MQQVRNGPLRSRTASHIPAHPTADEFVGPRSLTRSGSWLPVCSMTGIGSDGATQMYPRPAFVPVLLPSMFTSVLPPGRRRLAGNRNPLANGSLLSLIAICLPGLSGCGGGTKTPTAISIAGAGTSGSGSNAATATLSPGGMTRFADHGHRAGRNDGERHRPGRVYDLQCKGRHGGLHRHGDRGSAGHCRYHRAVQGACRHAECHRRLDTGKHRSDAGPSGPCPGCDAAVEDYGSF
jgi:hypothetical protein